MVKFTLDERQGRSTTQTSICTTAAGRSFGFLLYSLLSQRSSSQKNAGHSSSQNSAASRSSTSTGRLFAFPCSSMWSYYSHGRLGPGTQLLRLMAFHTRVFRATCNRDGSAHAARGAWSLVPSSGKSGDRAPEVLFGGDVFLTEYP